MSEFMRLLTDPYNPFGMADYEVEPMSQEEFDRICSGRAASKDEEEIHGGVAQSQ